MPKSRRYCLTCPYTDGCDSCEMRGGDQTRFSLVPLFWLNQKLDVERQKLRAVWQAKVTVLWVVVGIMTCLILLLSVSLWLVL